MKSNWATAAPFRTKKAGFIPASSSVRRPFSSKKIRRSSSTAITWELWIDGKIEIAPHGSPELGCIWKGSSNFPSRKIRISLIVPSASLRLVCEKMIRLSCPQERSQSDPLSFRRSTTFCTAPDWASRMMSLRSFWMATAAPSREKPAVIDWRSPNAPATASGTMRSRRKRPSDVSNTEKRSPPPS